MKCLVGIPRSPDGERRSIVMSGRNGPRHATFEQVFLNEGASAKLMALPDHASDQIPSRRKAHAILLPSPALPVTIPGERAECPSSQSRSGLSLARGLRYGVL